MTLTKWKQGAAAMALAALTMSLAAPSVAHADAVATLRAFVKDVKTGRADFTQVVTSPDGKRTRKSAGTLEFQRPNQFRFAYSGPTEQLIVGDGKQVWLYDTDLNQVTVRPMSQAVGATPAALLAGASLEKDFVLKNVPAQAHASGTASASGAAAATLTPSQATSNLEWLEAVPRHKDGQFQSVRVGFTRADASTKGSRDAPAGGQVAGQTAGQLAALEILDAFGQRSRLTFTNVASNVSMPAGRFSFTPPAGADVLNQP
jgi:outer membrane lipoprotein carrier protein